MPTPVPNQNLIRVRQVGADANPSAAAAPHAMQANAFQAAAGVNKAVGGLASQAADQVMGLMEKMQAVDDTRLSNNVVRRAREDLANQDLHEKKNLDQNTWLPNFDSTAEETKQWANSLGLSPKVKEQVLEELAHTQRLQRIGVEKRAFIHNSNRADIALGENLDDAIKDGERDKGHRLIEASGTKTPEEKREMLRKFNEAFDAETDKNVVEEFGNAIFTEQLKNYPQLRKDVVNSDLPASQKRSFLSAMRVQEQVKLADFAETVFTDDVKGPDHARKMAKEAGLSEGQQLQVVRDYESWLEMSPVDPVKLREAWDLVTKFDSTNGPIAYELTREKVYKLTKAGHREHILNTLKGKFHGGGISSDEKSLLKTELSRFVSEQADAGAFDVFETREIDVFRKQGTEDDATIVADRRTSTELNEDATRQRESDFFFDMVTEINAGKFTRPEQIRDEVSKRLNLHKVLPPIKGPVSLNKIFLDSRGQDPAVQNKVQISRDAANREQDAMYYRGEFGYDNVMKWIRATPREELPDLVEEKVGMKSPLVLEVWQKWKDEEDGVKGPEIPLGEPGEYGKHVQFSSSAARKQIAKSGGASILLDSNSAPGTKTTSPLIVVPDNATPDQMQAASDYVKGVASMINRRFGRNVKGRVVTRSQNKRGRSNAFHTEPFAVTDTEVVSWIKGEGGSEYAEVLKNTLGKIPGVNFFLPHQPGDPGATHKGDSEVSLARIIMKHL